MEFKKFISDYKSKLYRIFREENDVNKLSLKRGFSDELISKVMDSKPLSTFIPEKFGGRGVKTCEAISMLEASSYESLPLSLMMGINGALFLQPVARYGNEEVKRPIFSRFMEEGNMGGLMITEPDYGTDALSMETSYEKNGSSFEVHGTKHWAGLTGAADYWLITARKGKDDDCLGRDISFFIHDTRRGGIEVEEYFNNLGLYMLPYGRNNINITVPEEYKLQPNTIGIKMMQDILHRSRLQFPGMGMGFLKRLMVEAVEHCKQRAVGGQSLFNYGQVKRRLQNIQSSFTICSAMCAYTSSNIPIEKNTSGMSIAANTIKSYTTDLMQQTSQSVLQLMGAKGYRLDHIAGRSVVDSRPFQIFEGSNDVLYQQISESVLKKMRRLKLKNLHEFLSDYKLTERASDYFSVLLDFNISHNLNQDRLVELGRILSRVISLELTLRLSDSGFNRKLIDNTVQTLQREVKQIATSFASTDTPDVVEDYEESSSWLDTLQPLYVHS